MFQKKATNTWLFFYLGTKVELLSTQQKIVT
jgi:hypothetical protein